MYRMEIFLGIAKISNIFGVMPDIFFFGGGGTVDAGSEPTYEEKMRVPPPPPPQASKYLKIGTCPASQKLLTYIRKKKFH